MPAKTGASHGIAAFASMLIGTMLSKFVWDLLPPLGEFSLLMMELLNKQLGVQIPTSQQFAGSIIVMFCFSFLWGVVYHLGRH